MIVVYQLLGQKKYEYYTHVSEELRRRFFFEKWQVIRDIQLIPILSNIIMM